MRDATLTSDLDARLAGTPYQGYAYAYPHKTAYRALEPSVPLRELWAGERREALFLYVHVPFCEFRCGFCNLFTRANPADGLVARYLETLERQVHQVRASLHDDVSYARFAIGGGTPTQLEAAELARLLDLAQGVLGADLPRIPTSCEMSPETVDPEKLALLAARGVDRASLGVQSFLEDEARAAGRPQRTARVEQALGWIREVGFPVLNVDLIYGLPGQTAETWERSLREALAWRPEEVFLYPLYVRPLTGLSRRLPTTDPWREWPDDERLALYRLGRKRLLEAGYAQVSMRLFRAAHAPSVAGPDYCCQADGMIGLGCGARSYTRGLHYSGEYAVGSRGVREILESWVERDDASFARADYGFLLDAEDQRRRWAIQSLLWQEGLRFSEYRERFASDALTDLPQLGELEPRGLAVRSDEALRLTPAGLERSDVLGPWLASAKVQRLMEGYALR